MLQSISQASTLWRACKRWPLTARLYIKYRSATMVPAASFLANLDLVAEHLHRFKLDGAVIECGCWRGGMSATLIELCGPQRDYFFFDSFEGLPPAKPIDGAAALAWQANTHSPKFYNNCSASLDEFNATIALAKSQARIIPIKGFFEKTLREFNPPPIAILRLDADWYDLTMICLETLWDHVVPNGLILIDDYYTWDGCSRAIHDFLSSRKAAERIRQRTGLAYIVKTQLSEEERLASYPSEAEGVL